MSIVSVEECVNVLREARYEITSLRRQVAELAPRAAAYNVVERIVGMIPQPLPGYGTDIVWSIDQLLNDAKATPEEEL